MVNFREGVVEGCCPKKSQNAAFSTIPLASGSFAQFGTRHATLD
jgi:hypothetical protein